MELMNNTRLYVDTNKWFYNTST